MKEAEQARKDGEVPIGAVIVHKGVIIGRGHNRKEATNDPTAHAEMIAIRNATNHIDDWRLPDTTIYVTLEPCAMCTGAIIESRIPRLVYAAADPRMGCTTSIINLPEALSHLSPLIVISGISEKKSLELIKGFFKNHRH